MQDDLLRRRVDSIARATGLSGVVRVDHSAGTRVEAAFGFADRRHRIPNTVETRFSVASGMKGITALTIMSLVESEELDLETPARVFLGADLPLIHDEVTVEHLLGHTSGIGDYVDEAATDDIGDHVLAVPVHTLVDTEDYLGVLGGHPQVFTPGERFAYCNGGYVVLALIAERATGTPFDQLVSERVFQPAGMTSSAFLRSDELPGDAAVGYLAADGLRTNVLHLPVRGSGDGGVYTNAHDVFRLWSAMFAGSIVSPESVSLMTRPRSSGVSNGMDYALGFWLDASGRAVILEGYDAGVSFRSSHHPADKLTVTVISNTSSGAWPVVERLDEVLIG